MPGRRRAARLWHSAPQPAPRDQHGRERLPEHREARPTRRLEQLDVREGHRFDVCGYGGAKLPFHLLPHIIYGIGLLAVEKYLRASKCSHLLGVGRAVTLASAT